MRRAMVRFHRLVVPMREAIIAFPALVTGYYGMNVPYPDFAKGWVAVVSTGLMVVGTIGLYRLFRRIDWL
jgi:magnesium transporter